jgi:hypothetical protein
MPRADLLALTDEDLIALSNRGTVKRAQKELESGAPTCQIAEDGAGGVTVTWSDGIVCRFLHGKTVHDATCSSGSIGISRRLVRSVLAYQKANRAAPVATTDESPAAPADRAQEIWDPGQFTDEQLITAFKKPAVARARARFEQGVLVELARGAKPTARFLDEACMVRFAVPGELGYATADCAEPLWAAWIPLAVWAFRELPADQLAGLVSLQRATPAIPEALFSEVRPLLDELGRDGLANLAPSWRQRLARVEQRLRDAGLTWPAELALDLGQQQEAYQDHDARFDPEQVVLLVGELVARMRAIARGRTPVPQLLIRGTKSDRPTEIDAARYVGVGLGIAARRRHVTLRAYLQEANTGNVVAVERTFADPNPSTGTAPKSFAELGATVLTGGVSIAALAVSQLLVQAGKRTPGGQLLLPRLSRQLTIHPQTFPWEQLKAPFAAESIAQLRGRLRYLPPSYLRPRRATENLHGIALAGVQCVQFDPARQQLTATLHDARGDMATLVHPYLSRGAAGFSALAETLSQRGAQIRFVSGHVRAWGHGLAIQPVLLIGDDGGRRYGINPWIADAAASAAAPAESAGPASSLHSEPMSYLGELQRSISDALLTGLAHDAVHAPVMSQRTEQAHRLGLMRIADAVGQLADALAARSRVLRWDSARAVAKLEHLCVIVRVAAE